MLYGINAVVNDPYLERRLVSSMVVFASCLLVIGFLRLYVFMLRGSTLEFQELFCLYMTSNIRFLSFYVTKILLARCLPRCEFFRIAVRLRMTLDRNMSLFRHENSCLHTVVF